MQTPTLFSSSTIALVEMITEDMGHRCETMTAVMEASQQMERYNETVIAFVRCINADFFFFIEQLDRKLREEGFGSAKLSIDKEQPELVGTLFPYHEWIIRQFSLLRAHLNITLRYCVEGKLIRSEEISAEVRFYPNEGYLEWSDGTVEVFRSHRDNAFGKAEFGADEFLDFVSAIGIKPRGFDLRNGVTERYDPQFLVLRKIGVNKEWPGCR